jgi:hypothetical protein
MPTTTTNYSLYKPLVNDPIDEDLWGGYLNENADTIDLLIRRSITIPVDSGKTSSFTATASISERYLYPCDATSAAINVTLPLAATAANGAVVVIKKVDSSANAVNIIISGSDTIDGAASVSLSNKDDSYTLVSDGVDSWFSVNKPVTIPNASATQRGIVELATAAETLAGTDALRALTSAGFAGNKNLAAKGRYELPGKFALQWGTEAQIATNATSTVTFDKPFTTLLSLTITGQSTTLSAGSAYLHTPPTNNNFVWRSAGGPFALHWKAFGIIA